MALTNFVPTIWSRRLNVSLRRDLVGMSVVNEDYIGEVRAAGDTLKINRPAAINVGDYNVGSDITIQTPTSSQLELNIDQFKYVAFSVDDVRKVQANVELMAPYVNEANYALRKTVDEFIFGHYTGVDASNVVAKTVLAADTVYGKIAEAARRLDANDVPTDGRFLALSPLIVEFLRTSTQFTAASELGDNVKKTGLVGEILGFNIYRSNSLTSAADGSDTVQHCLFGHTSALTFGMQFTKMESARMEKQFSDLVKGLLIYGAQTVKAKALGDLRHITS